MKPCAKWILLIVTLLINIAAWMSKSFSDFCISYIFPVWLNSYGRMTSLIPFSLGECMLAAAVFFAVVAVILGILYVFHCKRIKNVAYAYYRFISWLVILVFFEMTFSCFIMYHASTFGEQYLPFEVSDNSKELMVVRDYVVDQLNQRASQFERDKNGYIIYDADFNFEAIKAMKELGEIYPQLSGYYPSPKKIQFSDFLSQQFMMGYYFPFSMEANYNNSMYIARKPSVICHELAHTKGFICEDDANFIGYLASINSDDRLFQYSGYLGVVNYLEKDAKQIFKGHEEEYKTHVQLDAQVKADNVFLTKEAWRKVEAKAVVDTKVVKTVSTTFIDTNLKVNGIKEGSISYSKVVELLLKYYNGKLY